MRHSYYIQLAELFDFPGPEYPSRGKAALELLRAGYPEAARQAERFLRGIPENLLDHQELYTRTFDVQAITTLDVGYVLFGDDYKRAELLSNLTREHILAGTDRKGELGDHLPNVLRLMPKLRDARLLEELVGEILVPALMLMIREFGPERIEKKNLNYRKHYKTVLDSAPGAEATVYRAALSALLEVLREDFEVEETIARLERWSDGKRSADFLGSIEREMTIERLE